MILATVVTLETLFICALLGMIVWYFISQVFLTPQDVPVDIATMSDEDKANVIVGLTESMPDKIMDEPMPTGETATNQPAQVVAQGEFQAFNSSYTGEGTATIYQLSDGSYILRFEDFRSTNGPDLHVILSNESDGLTEESLDLAPLKGNIGNQNYEISGDTDVTQFKSVIIYCVPFQVIFSTAKID
jgi:hypothetical protein